MGQLGQCKLSTCQKPAEVDAWGRFEMPAGPRVVQVGWVSVPLCQEHDDLLEGPSITNKPELP